MQRTAGLQQLVLTKLVFSYEPALGARGRAGRPAGGGGRPRLGSGGSSRDHLQVAGGDGRKRAVHQAVVGQCWGVIGPTGVAETVAALK